ncbi:MAG TPA: VWA domain-containing protein [Vicinamibacterales bacterium]|nr:VWA domain-containing protein [Vicinamibacterales bacterium]
MTRFLTSSIAVASAGILLAAAPQQPVFRTASDAVRVFVTVLDRDGRLVTGLTQDKFEVRDEGKPQPITQFDNKPQPIRLIVLLDVSGSMAGNLPLLRGAAEQLFTRLLPGDQARVGSFGHEVVLAPAFTSDRRELTASLPTAIAPDAPTPLWRAVVQAIRAFDGADDRRKVILVLSDGKDSGPISFRDRPSSQADAIDRARDEDVMIYGIGMRSRGARPPQTGAGPGGLQAMLLADMPDPGLARVAEETGGGYTEIRFGQDLGAAFAAVADELHTQYLLAFAPPQRDGKVHDVSVRVSEKGLKPRARRSYVAPKAERPASDVR